MTNELEIIRGIHPGLALERKLQEKKIRKGKLALQIREYPQTITTITKGRRDMNPALAMKLERELDLEEGYFMILQVFYDIKILKNKEPRITPELNKLRPVIFWDTKINRIDWDRQYKAVINRVFEKGNDQEKAEITRFYGQQKVSKVLNEK